MKTPAPAENDDERSLVHVKPHIAAQSGDFPLRLLSDRHFEILSRDLLKVEAMNDENYDRASLLLPGADRGRDILLVGSQGTFAVVQCKRLGTKLTTDQILGEVIKFCLHSVRDPSIFPFGERPQYQFWTATGVTTAAGKLFDVPQAWEETITASGMKVVDGVREKYTALKASGNVKLDEAENRRALSLARRVRPLHVGPEDINLLVSRHADVRRLHFRSPDDGPARATAREIEALVVRWRLGMLRKLRNADDPYVPRQGLQDAFEHFLDADQRVFSLIGGSGQGKTSWAATLLAAPPQHFSVDVIRVTDIVDTDQHVGMTIARQLTAGRLGPVPTHDIGQSVLDWLDAANRIIVVEGLDRAETKMRSILAGWIDNTITLLSEASAKLVLTSRPESWNSIASRCLELGEAVYQQDGDRSDPAVSFRLGMVTPAERGLLYEAYSIDPVRQRGGKLHTPSLIRQLARLQATGNNAVIARADILHEEIAAVRVELERADLGETTVPLLFARFQELLLETDDGWIDLNRLIAAPGNLQPAVDYLVRRDRASLSTATSKIRLESDDLIEAMMARGLDMPRVLSKLAAGRPHSIFMGALALMIAAMEQDSPEEARHTVQIILDEQTSINARMRILFKTVSELRDSAASSDMVRSEFVKFEKRNFLIQGSGLEEFFADSTIPVASLLELIWNLIEGEDADDWRSIHWFEPRRPGRMITPVTRAISEIVNRSPVEALPFLLKHAGSPERLHDDVATFLLREAALRAPDETLEATYAHALTTSPHAFQQVMMSIPGPALRFLAFGEVGALDRRYVAQWAYQLATQSRPTERPGSIDPGNVVVAMDSLLDGPWRDDERVTLLIGRLSARADDALRRELLQRWDFVPWAYLWEAFGVAGEGRVALLGAFMFGRRAQSERDAALRPFSPGLLEEDELVDVVALLERYRMLGTEQEVLVANAVEWLLYAEETRSGGRACLDDLALEIASSANEKAREQLIYYAAGTSPDASPATNRRKETLLTNLIRVERGENLNTFLWKLSEAHLRRPMHVAHGLKLVEAFGWERVEAELDDVPDLSSVTGYLEKLRGQRDPAGPTGIATPES